MANETIETRAAEIWLGDDGIVRNTFLSQVEVTEDDAREIRDANTKVTMGKKVPLLVDARKVKSVTRRARTFGARDENIEHRSAVAVLVGSPLSRTIGNIFMKINNPPYPTHLFTSEAEAIQWLKGFLD